MRFLYVLATSVLATAALAQQPQPARPAMTGEERAALDAGRYLLRASMLAAENDRLHALVETQEAQIASLQKQIEEFKKAAAAPSPPPPPN